MDQEDEAALCEELRMRYDEFWRDLCNIWSRDGFVVPDVDLPEAAGEAEAEPEAIGDVAPIPDLQVIDDMPAVAAVPADAEDLANPEVAEEVVAEDGIDGAAILPDIVREIDVAQYLPQWLLMILQFWNG